MTRDFSPLIKRVLAGVVYPYNLRMEILILDHCGARQNGLDMRISNMYLGGQSE